MSLSIGQIREGDVRGARTTGDLGSVSIVSDATKSCESNSAQISLGSFGNSCFSKLKIVKQRTELFSSSH